MLRPIKGISMSTRSRLRGGFTLPELLVAMSVASAISIAIFTTIMLVSDVYRKATSASNLVSRQVLLSDFFTTQVQQAGSIDWDSSFLPISEPMVLSLADDGRSSILRVEYDTSSDQRERIEVALSSCTVEPQPCGSEDSYFLIVSQWIFDGSSWSQVMDREVLGTDIDGFEISAESDAGVIATAFPGLFDYQSIALLNIDLILRSRVASLESDSRSYETALQTHSFNDGYERVHLALTLVPRTSL